MQPAEAHKGGMPDKKREILIHDARDVLQPGEEVLDLAGTPWSTSSLKLFRYGALRVFVTDRRVFTFQTSAIGGRRRVKDFTYGLISSVDAHRGLIFGNLSLGLASGQPERIFLLPRGDVERLATLIRDRIGAARAAGTANPAPPAAPASAPSAADELTKLADLRDRGVITEAQFTEQRDRLLGQ